MAQRHQYSMRLYTLVCLRQNKFVVSLVYFPVNCSLSRQKENEFRIAFEKRKSYYNHVSLKGRTAYP